MPTRKEFSIIKAQIESTSKKLCHKIKGSRNYECDPTINCYPVHDLDIIIDKYKQHSILTPFFKLHNAYYGIDDGMNAFAINITKLIMTYNLRLVKGHNEQIFSMLYLFNKTLITYSNLPEGAKVICELSHSQCIINLKVP